ncbi:hypothetical protein LS684_19085 [Cytobacillus spongiae]|uniref:hypothetical protein n=1 Tax=Cytobacillus spongiae TaxID=2901381 RepID=UPI001F3C72AE|nr:hypothetical protein [Cytobacillus spongiae]UII55704.1 hypothetical protein LS684_19085 [Cytobacillus spongiae]
MYKDLSQGIKISITRSITTAFEQYMMNIRWNENKYNLEDFISEWKGYITKHSSWYDKIDANMKADPAFHEELAVKINETLDKLLTEKPTADQMNEIDELQEKLGAEYDYSCKLEAKFLIDTLKEELKKKQSN